MPNVRGNDDALAAFVAHKSEIDVLLNRLKALSDDHFGVAPDDVNWGHVGVQAECATLLRQTIEFARGNQASKSSK